MGKFILVIITGTMIVLGVITLNTENVYKPGDQTQKVDITTLDRIEEVIPPSEPLCTGQGTYQDNLVNFSHPCYFETVLSGEPEIEDILSHVRLSDGVSHTMHATVFVKRFPLEEHPSIKNTSDDPNYKKEDIEINGTPAIALTNNGAKYNKSIFVDLGERLLIFAIASSLDNESQDTRSKMNQDLAVVTNSIKWN